MHSYKSLGKNPTWKLPHSLTKGLIKIPRNSKKGKKKIHQVVTVLLLPQKTQTPRNLERESEEKKIPIRPPLQRLE